MGKLAKVLVMSPEGGGNHLLLALLQSHPRLKKEDVILRSLASGRLGYWRDVPVPPRCKGVGFWVPITFLKNVDRTVLSTRSPVHAAFSAWKRFGKCTEGGVPMCIWHQLAARYYIKMLELSSYPTITTSYDKIVQNTQVELSRLAAFLGLIPDTWDYKVHSDFYDWGDIVNRNDDRWKGDKEFCGMWDRYGRLFDVQST